MGTLTRKKGEILTTGFFADFPEEALLPAGEKVFNPVVDFLGELLFDPRLADGSFLPDVFEGEKRNLLDTIDWRLNDKRTYSVYRMIKNMCKDEAYGVPRLGERPEAEAITRDALLAWYRRMLRHSRIELFYVSRARRRERGYDQAECLARAVGAELGMRPRRILIKKRNNPAQSGIPTPEQRRANVLGVYEVRDHAAVQGKIILLIDDVTTTGATLSECCRTLLDAGAAQIFCAVLRPRAEASTPWSRATTLSCRRAFRTKLFPKEAITRNFMLVFPQVLLYSDSKHVL